MTRVQGYKCSQDELRHRRMVQNNSRCLAGMSSVTHSSNFFLERIMSDALEEHDGKVRIGGRNITILWFVDDIDALAEEEQELGSPSTKSRQTCTRHKVEISAEKTKQMTNSADGIHRVI